jgi:nucleoside-diphosphate-sugar epimerase
MKERVLITGASGFIGYHLIDEALKNNLDVYAAVRKSSKTSHLSGFNIHFTYPDFSSIDALTKEIAQNKYSYIIHAAGLTKARSQEEYNDVNAGYTRNLAFAALASNVPIKKFVLVGSLAAMGPLNNIDSIIDEHTIPHPVTAYGKSKLQAEEELKSFPSLNYTILRPTGVYGPRDRDIFIFFQQVARHIEPYIGRMDQKFSFLYVADLARATIKALFNGEQKAYILSDGGEYDRYALGDYIRKCLGVKTVKIHLPVKFVKSIAYFSEKYGSLNKKAVTLNVEKLNELMAVNWNCDIASAKRDLGYAPAFDLEAGVAETINWYKTNKWL